MPFEKPAQPPASEQNARYNAQGLTTPDYWSIFGYAKVTAFSIQGKYEGATEEPGGSPEGGSL